MHVRDILLKVKSAQNTNVSQYILVNHVIYKTIIRCSSVYIIRTLSPQHPPAPRWFCLLCVSTGCVSCVGYAYIIAN